MKRNILNYILFICLLLILTGCGKSIKNTYQNEDTIGKMKYIISKKPIEKIDNGEKINGDEKYHLIRYDYGNFYIVFKNQSDKIEQSFDYVEKNVNGVKFKYCDSIQTGTGLRYSSIFEYDREYYLIEYF